MMYVFLLCGLVSLLRGYVVEASLHLCTFTERCLANEDGGLDVELFIVLPDVDSQSKRPHVSSFSLLYLGIKKAFEGRWTITRRSDLQTGSSVGISSHLGCIVHSSQRTIAHVSLP